MWYKLLNKYSLYYIKTNIFKLIKYQRISTQIEKIKPRELPRGSLLSDPKLLAQKHWNTDKRSDDSKRSITLDNDTESGQC